MRVRGVADHWNLRGVTLSVFKLQRVINGWTKEVSADLMTAKKFGSIRSKLGGSTSCVYLWAIWNVKLKISYIWFKYDNATYNISSSWSLNILLVKSFRKVKNVRSKIYNLQLKYNFFFKFKVHIFRRKYLKFYLIQIFLNFVLRF